MKKKIIIMLVVFSYKSDVIVITIYLVNQQIVKKHIVKKKVKFIISLPLLFSLPYHIIMVP